MDSWYESGQSLHKNLNTSKRDGTFPIAANHFAALNGLFPLAASKAR